MPKAIEVAIINPKVRELQVADIANDDFISLVQEDGSLMENVKLPVNQELNTKLKTMWNDNKDNAQVFFTLVQIAGENGIVSGRIEKN